MPILPFPVGASVMYLLSLHKSSILFCLLKNKEKKIQKWKKNSLNNFPKMKIVLSKWASDRQ